MLSLGLKRSLAAAGIAAALAGAANAGEFNSALSMMWDASGDSIDAFTYDPTEFGTITELGGGTYGYEGGFVGETFTLDWLCNVNANGSAGAGGSFGFVDSSIVVSNTSSEVQTFSMLMSVALDSVIAGPTSVDGSAGYTVTNNAVTGDATISAPDGGSLYKGFIDLVDPFADPAFTTLYDAPFSDTAAGAFASSSDSDTFAGLGGPTASDNIAILLTFTLSPGDSATVTGTMTIIPAPGAFAMLGLAGLAGGRRRRRG